MSKLQNLLKGIIKENPTLVLVLGTCPTLATTTSVLNALGMGVAATAVLICSNIAISALRKVIPDKVRIPCYIVLIAGFVTIIEMLMHAFVPDLYESSRRPANTCRPRRSTSRRACRARCRRRW